MWRLSKSSRKYISRLKSDIQQKFSRKVGIKTEEDCKAYQIFIFDIRKAVEIKQDEILDIEIYSNKFVIVVTQILTANGYS